MNRCIVTILLGLLLSCTKKAETTHPHIQKITESVYASGVVKSNNQDQVFAAANGLLKEVYVTEGDLVKTGQPLMRLSDVTGRLNIENARIAAEYNSLQANTEKLNQAKLDIELAKAKMDNDASLLERQKTLWTQGIGSKLELEQRELALKNSTTFYNQARVRYSDLQKQLDFASRQSQKNLQIIRSGVSDLTIKSEVNGKVFRVLKEKGEMVTVQTPVAILGDSSGYLLELQVDEYDITRVALGQKIWINMDSYKGKVFEAEVVKIDPIMNEQSKSFTIEAVFINAPPTLYPNLTVEGNIVIAVKEKALLIPRDYLVDDEYVLLPNKEKRKVQTGLKDYQQVEILQGLSAEDEILKPQ
jgi:multidrug efflux pump subunit AcrA (membrane-fusion protein)